MAIVSDQVTLSLHMFPKWWMRPALWAAFWALQLRLVRDKPSAEHFGGIITANERVSKWLANYAFRFEVRRERIWEHYMRTHP